MKLIAIALLCFLWDWTPAWGQTPTRDELRRTNRHMVALAKQAQDEAAAGSH